MNIYLFSVGSNSGSRPASRNTDSKHGSLQSLDSCGKIIDFLISFSNKITMFIFLQTEEVRKERQLLAFVVHQASNGLIRPLVTVLAHQVLYHVKVQLLHRRTRLVELVRVTPVVLALRACHLAYLAEGSMEAPLLAGKHIFKVTFK